MKQKIKKYSAYAKINLMLMVLNKRSDGYHDICSVMQKVNLCDYLTIQPNDKLEVKFNVNLEIPAKENIVLKAARLLNRITQQKNTALIEIEKNIPIGAGLGGGSSDAATALVALNDFWNLKLPFEELVRLGAKLGSDVPFFFYNKPSLVFGKGDFVQPLEDSNSAYCLLVYPNFKVNTAEAYNKLNRDIGRKFNSHKKKNVYRYLLEQMVSRIFTKNNFFKFNPLVFNHFEGPVFEMHPELKILKKRLMSVSNEWALLSGSGSTVYTIFSTLESAKNAQKEIADLNYQTFITQMID